MLNKLDEKVRAYFWSIRVLINRYFFSIAKQTRFPISRSFCSGVVPKTESIKTAIGCERTVVSVKLPLSSNRCVVAGILHHRPEGLLFGVKFPKNSVVSNVVPPGHDFDTTRGTNGFGVAEVKLDASFGKFIEAGCFEMGAAIATNVIVGDVVRHD